MSLRRFLKWILLLFAVYGCYFVVDHACVLYQRFHFHGELRTLGGWLPSTANKARLRIAVVYPKDFPGEANVAQSFVRALRARNISVYECLISPDEPRQKARKVKRVQRWLNWALNTDTAVVLFARSADRGLIRARRHYISAFNVEDIHGLETLFFREFSGYLCGGVDQSWLHERLNTIYHANKPKQLFFPPSVHGIAPKGPAEPRKIFWCGKMWDKTRRVTYKPLFEKLCAKKQVVIYGLNTTWQRPELAFAKPCYQGFIPFDKQQTFLKKMRKAGIALCLHSPAHLRYGTTSARLMEASAAGVLIITDNNPFARHYFGDNALYIDQTQDPLTMYRQVNQHLQWAQSNPEAAKAKAWATHQVFKEKFAMEKLTDTFLTHVMHDHAKHLSAKSTKQRPGFTARLSNWLVS
ncbi:MAG: glycosyltransferase family protein [Holosporaceae bacterium]